MAIAAVMAFAIAGCSSSGSSKAASASGSSASASASASASSASADAAAAAAVDEAIAKIQVQERTATTDADCEAAKKAWDALTPAQQELVAEKDYFALDTGDASKDDPLATAPDKDKEILVVSFGTSFNVVQRQPRCHDWRRREGHCRRVPRLRRPPRVYGPDHHQPCPGSRWREDQQHGAGSRSCG